MTIAARDPSASLPPPGVASRYVMAGGIRTHYLEAGNGEPLILLHSAEFGGRAEFSWPLNIPALAARFRVLALDVVGFGRTEKIVNFSDQAGSRVKHVRDFMDVLCVESAHFMGNSFGGSLIQTVAGQDHPAWNIRSIVSVSGGGFAPDNDARKVLTNYEGTREGMVAILKVLFWHERWWADDIVDRRWKASIEPGAWEAVAAARLSRPGKPKAFGSERGDPAKIGCPVLIIGGAEDLLREPGCWEDLHTRIPGSELKVFAQARHCPHIDHADDFNVLALDFLTRHSAQVGESEAEMSVKG